MSFAQRGINSAAIALVFCILYYLSNNLSLAVQNEQIITQITKSISSAETLSPEIIAEISKIAQQPVSRENQQSSFCFIKAYHEIVIKSSINPKQLFNLFEDSQAEFEKITNCTQYYALLLFKSKQFDVNISNKLMTLLDYQIDIKYPQYRKSTICLYFYVHNSQSTIKQQFKSIIEQRYESLNVFIEDDASNDNSPMLLNYLINNNPNSIKFTTSKEQRNILKGFAEFINKCPQNSIITLLQGNQHLLSPSSIQIINRIFSNEKIDLAFFASLTTPHLSLQTISDASHPHSQLNPLFAARKTWFEGINYNINGYQGIERNFISSQLLKKIDKNAVQIVKEPLVYHHPSRNQTLTEKLRKFSEQVQ